MSKQPLKPELKAKELIEKFIDHVKSERPPKPNGYFHAKACAIIHCDKIIELLEGWPPPRDTTIELEITRYKKVKQEIQKL